MPSSPWPSAATPSRSAQPASTRSRSRPASSWALERERVEGAYERWLALFDTVTLPFYWSRFEPDRGRPDTARLMAAARWFRERGVPAKGHPLCWHTLCAPWLDEAPPDAVADALRARIARDVGAFAGLIDAWDAINEPVIMPVFDRYPNGPTRLAATIGRVETVRLAFEAARAANPGATLLINDFDLSPDYARLVAECLAAGIRIDAIGLQSHMHQGYWGEERTARVLERFAGFGLPLHWTETTIVSGDLMPAHVVDLNDWQPERWPSTPDGERRQADEVVRHYRTLAAHPSVASITWWELVDGGWLGAPAGLLRADGSPKPAYDALRALVRDEWWLAPVTLRTDGDGLVRVAGMAGTYEVSTASGSVRVELGPADEPVLARLGGEA